MPRPTPAETPSCPSLSGLRKHLELQHEGGRAEAVEEGAGVVMPATQLELDVLRASEHVSPLLILSAALQAGLCVPTSQMRTLQARLLHGRARAQTHDSEGFSHEFSSLTRRLTYSQKPREKVSLKMSLLGSSWVGLTASRGLPQGRMFSSSSENIVYMFPTYSYSLLSFSMCMSLGNQDGPRAFPTAPPQLSVYGRCSANARDENTDPHSPVTRGPLGHRGEAGPSPLDEQSRKTPADKGQGDLGGRADDHADRWRLSSSTRLVVKQSVNKRAQGQMQPTQVYSLAHTWF